MVGVVWMFSRDLTPEPAFSQATSAAQGTSGRPDSSYTRLSPTVESLLIYAVGLRRSGPCKKRVCVPTSCCAAEEGKFCLGSGGWSRRPGLELEQAVSLEDLIALTLTQPLPANTPRSIDEIWSLLSLSGAASLREVAPVSIPTMGNMRQCKHSRAEAVMSVLGTTEWHRKRVARAETSLMFGRFPMDFLQEVRYKFGARFFKKNHGYFLEIFADGNPMPEPIGSLLPFGSMNNESFMNGITRHHSLNGTTQTSLRMMAQRLQIGAIGVYGRNYGIPTTSKSQPFGTRVQIRIRKEDDATEKDQVQKHPKITSWPRGSQARGFKLFPAPDVGFRYTYQTAIRLSLRLEVPTRDTAFPKSPASPLNHLLRFFAQLLGLLVGSGEGFLRGGNFGLNSGEVLGGGCDAGFNGGFAPFGGGESLVDGGFARFGC